METLMAEFLRDIIQRPEKVDLFLMMNVVIVHAQSNGTAKISKFFLNLQINSNGTAKIWKKILFNFLN